MTTSSEIRAGPSGTRRWSLAARLAFAYAVSAFLLVAVATGLQYHTLVSSFAAEDDQLLLERLNTALSDLTADLAPPLRELQDGSGTTASLRVRVLDRNCAPTTRARKPLTLPAPACPRQERFGASAPVLRSVRGPDGADWRTVLAPFPGDLRDSGSIGWVEVLLDRSRDRDVLDRFLAEAAFTLLGSLVVAAVLGYTLARRGLRPLITLRERAARIDARALSIRLVTPDAPVEVAALAASFDAMLTRLEGAFESLTLRSAELAHELRTPLHVLRQQAEVALSRLRTPEEYRDILGSSLEELHRISRLADDMLFLARASDPRSVIAREPLVAATELTDVAVFLEALAEEQHVTIDVHAPCDLVVVADRTLLRRAMVNLVTNALRHTPAGGRVSLSAKAIEASGGVLIVVEDTGSGLTPELRLRAFEPHARGSTSGSGAGLGLSIVRGIAAMHGATAVLESELDRGTRVTLTFPQ